MALWVKLLLSVVLPVAALVAVAFFVYRRRSSPRNAPPEMTETVTGGGGVGGGAGGGGGGDAAASLGLGKLNIRYHATSGRAGLRFQQLHHHHHAQVEVRYRGAPQGPFQWENHPRLVTEAAENGWGQFVFAHFAVAPPRTRSTSSSPLWGLCPACDSGTSRDMAEADWEVPAVSSERMQAVRLNPVIAAAASASTRKWLPGSIPSPLRGDQDAGNNNALCIARMSLPLPGPPLAGAPFPQDAYFEITIIYLNTWQPEWSASRTSRRGSDGSGERDRAKLISFVPDTARNAIQETRAATKDDHQDKQSLQRQTVMSMGLAAASRPSLAGTYASSIGFHSNGAVYLDGNQAHLKPDQNLNLTILLPSSPVPTSPPPAPPRRRRLPAAGASRPPARLPAAGPSIPVPAPARALPATRARAPAPPRRRRLPAADASPPPTPPGRRPASPPPAPPFQSPHPRALPATRARAPHRRRAPPPAPPRCRPARLLTPLPRCAPAQSAAGASREPHARSLPPALPAAGPPPPSHLPAAPAASRRRRRRRRLPAGALRPCPLLCFALVLFFLLCSCEQLMMVTGSDEDNVAGACAGAANAGQSNKDKGKGTMTAGRSTMTDTNVEVVCKNGRRVKLKNSIEYIWSHGEKYKVNGFSCYYCPTSIAGGGATRFRQHLAGVSGNVVPCENVPLNVKTLMIDQVANRRIRSKKNKDLQQFIQMEIMTGGHGHRSYGKTGIPPDEEAQIQMAMRESLAEYAFEKGTPPSLVKSRGSGVASCSANHQPTNNPIMDWFCNSRNESAPILDEFIESDLETANPSTFIAQELEMDETEVAAFKKDTLQKRAMSMRSLILMIVKVMHGHDDDGGVGETHGDEECVDGGQTSGGGATNKHPTPLRPRSKRVKKLSVLLRD
ncbi:hypothetical protein GUJ93_ZPchr0006g45537 [Zizania palustris]|uniref:BED-type domain-containing protein n=1 Tax=Zizania palustris TaxID=103762 RepID=A0A8J5W2U7_ZIZPA|nr:hypothetical protein GUJ93_ZPchr0006g45537 [Zizania palustris]